MVRWRAPRTRSACSASGSAVPSPRFATTGLGPRVLSGLPSLLNGSSGDVLGPSDIDITGSQKFVLSIGLGGSDAFRAAFGSQGALLGTLVTGKLKQGGFSLFADVVANEAAANPDGTDIDSNPVGLVRDGEGYILADAGGNAVVRASHKGTFTTITPLPPTSIGADAVPTWVVQGEDRAYYISQLTGFPFQVGASNIWRVVPGQAPTVYASGLTNVTDLAFGPDGSLYAVEIASNGLLNEHHRRPEEDQPRKQSACDSVRRSVRSLRRRTNGRGGLRHHRCGARRRRRGHQDPPRLTLNPPAVVRRWRPAVRGPSSFRDAGHRRWQQPA